MAETYKTRPMRLLSLDFDGVLHDADAWPSTRRFIWVPLLARLLESWPEVRVAVHSIWRLDHTEEQLKALLGPLVARYLWAAPTEARELAVWEMVHVLGDTLTDWCVVDDRPEEFFDLEPHRLIVCDPKTGISGAEAQRRLQAWPAGA